MREATVSTGVAIGTSAAVLIIAVPAHADQKHGTCAFQIFAQHGDDADLNAWASKTLPTVQEPGRLTKTTAASLGASTAQRARHNRHAAADSMGR